MPIQNEGKEKKENKIEIRGRNRNGRKEGRVEIWVLMLGDTKTYKKKMKKRERENGKWVSEREG